MVNNLKEKQKLYLILILVLFQSIVPEIYASFGLSFKTSLPIGGFFLYALLGYFLSKNEFDKCNKVLYSLAAFATISLIVRYVMIYESEVKSNTCFTYFGLFAILPSMLIFLIVRRFYVHSHVTLFTWLSRKSYGIFLIHTFFITMLSRVFPMNHPLFIPISAIFIYLFSAVIVHILQKSRATKWLVP
jgi:surface polysaccharide O-acyltransferase-like enzyme